MDGGHLNFRGLEVFSEHALQRGDGRLHCLIIAELRVALEALLQEVVRLLVFRACACGLPCKVKTLQLIIASLVAELTSDLCLEASQCNRAQWPGSSRIAHPKFVR